MFKRFLVLALVSVASQVHGGTLTNGDLTVVVRDDNGAINNTTFLGTEFFRLGTFVSDFGIQTSSGFFGVNDSGDLGVPSDDLSASVVGDTVTGSGGGIEFVRNYSLLAGLNVLRVTTQLTNTGATQEVGYFDTFDPDQNAFSTINDVFALAGGTVGQAISTVTDLTVIAGSLDSRVTVEAGGPGAIFEIDTPGFADQFFTSPDDGDGATADVGLHIGIRTIIASGETTQFSYDLAFGEDPGAAQDAFIAAAQIPVPMPPVAAVPEPSSLMIFGLLGAGFGAARRRRRNRA